MASCKIRVKAAPGARSDEVAGWLGDAVKVRVAAPATDGKANARLCAFLAETLGLPRGAVSVAAGASGRQKIVAVEGLAEEEATRILAAAAARHAGGA
jgi:hypothetical protein